MTINHLVGQQTVFKHVVDLNKGGPHRVEMPVGSKILSAQRQHDEQSFCIWALTPMPVKRTEARTIVLVGTGNPFPAGVNSVEFIDTVQFAGGQLVLHVFEVKS